MELFYAFPLAWRQNHLHAIAFVALILALFVYLVETTVSKSKARRKIR
jgi:hypothetical protein